MKNYSDFILEGAPKREFVNIQIPLLYVVKLDETQDWRDDIVERAGKVYGIYLVDKNNENRFGDLWLQWLGNQVENIDNWDMDKSEDVDDLESIEYSSEGEDEYLTLRDIEPHIADEVRVSITVIESATNDDYSVAVREARQNEKNYKEFLSSIFEYYRGNSAF